MTGPPAASLLSGWLAVCGLQREAKLWGGRAVVGGGQSDQLARRLETAIMEGRPPGLVSFGLAGALAADLNVGDALIAGSVVTDRERWDCDQAVSKTLAAALGLPIVDLFGSDQVIAGLEAKRALNRLGAAVDMESQAAARVAGRHGLPLVVLRVISDAADDVLPPAAVAGFREDGGIDVLAVIAALARDPRQLPDLMKMGRNSGVAFGRLRTLARQAAG